MEQEYQMIMEIILIQMYVIRHHLSNNNRCYIANNLLFYKYVINSLYKLKNVILIYIKNLLFNKFNEFNFYFIIK